MALNLSELEKLYRTMNNDAKMIPKQLPSEEGRFLLTKCKLFYPLPLRISSQWDYR